MNQRGFSTVEVVMAIVIVALLGAVGYLGYQAMSKKDTQSSQSNISSSQTSANTSKDSHTVQLAEAKKVVGDFYREYNDEASATASNGIDAASDSTKLQSIVKKYGTQEFVSKYESNPTDANPILCTQSPSKELPRITASIIENGQPKLTVAQSYAEGPDKTMIVTTTSSSSPKIASVTCANS